MNAIRTFFKAIFIGLGIVGVLFWSIGTAAIGALIGAVISIPLMFIIGIAITGDMNGEVAAACAIIGAIIGFLSGAVPAVLGLTDKTSARGYGGGAGVDMDDLFGTSSGSGVMGSSSWTPNQFPIGSLGNELTSNNDYDLLGMNPYKPGTAEYEAREMRKGNSGTLGFNPNSYGSAAYEMHEMAKDAKSGNRYGAGHNSNQWGTAAYEIHEMRNDAASGYRPSGPNPHTYGTEAYQAFEARKSR